MKEKSGPKRGRGRPPKPLDLHAALELTLFGSSLREKARLAGCSPRTLMGRYGELIELAEARMSGFLKARLFHLALFEECVPALLFLLRQIYKEEELGAERPAAGAGKWSRRLFQQAQRIVWRYSVRKPRNTYQRPPTPKGRKSPPSRNRGPHQNLFRNGGA